MEEPISQHEIKALLLENQRLLTDNNRLLRKLHRGALWSMVFRLLWLGILFGAPLVVYYLYIEPNLETLKAAMAFFDSESFNLNDLRQLYFPTR